MNFHSKELITKLVVLKFRIFFDKTSSLATVVVVVMGINMIVALPVDRILKELLTI